MPSVFTRIIDRQAPAKIFYETEEVIVIEDRHPRDAVHLLIIPKREYPTFYDTPPEVIQLLADTARIVADKLGISDHFRLEINNGYCQEIYHIHFHFKSNRGKENLRFIEV
jgi:histidine triad (HIT) family protein